MEYFFAPMEGVTYSTYRRVHHEFFPGAAAYYTPFIAPDSAGTFKPKFLKELTRDRSDTLKIVPQLMSNNAESFVITIGKLKELGFDEVNLNAGCPSGTVFAKHKGSGMLTDLNSFDAFLKTAYNGAERLHIAVSIKTRMGVHSTSEFQDILDIYKKYPVSRLIIHARDRDGLYQSEPDLDGFCRAYEQCACSEVTGSPDTYRFPVMYNGNIFSAKELKTVTDRVPDLSSVMTGRGVIANPALIRTLQGGEKLNVTEFEAFHNAVIDAYLSDGLCERFTLERMKQLWYYMIHMFSDYKKEQKAILKSGSLQELRSNAGALFRSGKFNPNGKFYQV